jgi:hypothetical protein
VQETDVPAGQPVACAPAGARPLGPGPPPARRLRRRCGPAPRAATDPRRGRQGQAALYPRAHTLHDQAHGGPADAHQNPLRPSRPARPPVTPTASRPSRLPSGVPSGCAAQTNAGSADGPSADGASPPRASRPSAPGHTSARGATSPAPRSPGPATASSGHGPLCRRRCCRASSLRAPRRSPQVAIACAARPIRHIPPSDGSAPRPCAWCAGRPMAQNATPGARLAGPHGGLGLASMHHSSGTTSLPWRPLAGVSGVDPPIPHQGCLLGRGYACLRA